MAGITRQRLKELVKEVMTEESEYQTFFQKALDKAGKSIPSMSDDEKKAFFDKIDSAWNGKGEKNEELVGGQKELDVDGDGDISGDDLADLRAGKKADESVNEAEDINWSATENAIINFLKANTKILDKRVKDRDTDGVKKGLQSIIDGLTNAQRSLKLK
jgi:Ca2+-binding EF-hand superfamily protein